MAGGALVGGLFYGLLGDAGVQGLFALGRGFGQMLANQSEPPPGLMEAEFPHIAAFRDNLAQDEIPQISLDALVNVLIQEWLVALHERFNVKLLGVHGKRATEDR